MRRVVLWVTACNFNAIILNRSIFSCLITSASTLLHVVDVCVFGSFTMSTLNLGISISYINLILCLHSF